MNFPHLQLAQKNDHVVHFVSDDNSGDSARHFLEDDEEGDPVERLALDLLVVLLPQLQLTVRLGKAEEDLGEAVFRK